MKEVNILYYNAVLLNGGNPTAFFDSLDKVASRLDISFEWLCNAIWCESKFKPTAKNPVSTASGLIQMLDSNCRAFASLPATEFVKLTNLKQLPGIEAYLKSMIKSAGKPKDWVDTYCLIFQPAWVGKPDTVMLSASASKANSYIDANKDGFVTKGEFRIWANKQLPLSLSTWQLKKVFPI